MGRAPCCDKVGLKKGPWTPEEDQILISFIQNHGHSNWRALPKQAGLLRCGKSCRLRWINYLRPDIKRGNFTKEEEDIIIQLHEMMGNRWSAIAARLPGRTDNEIKNVWHTHLKKRLQQHQIPKPQSKTSTPKHREVNNNVTISKSTSANNLDETSNGSTIDQVTTSSQQSYTSDGLSSNTEVSSNEVSTNINIVKNEQNLESQQFDLDYFPIIDETFWSPQDIISDDNNTSFMLENTIIDNNQLQSSFSDNISSESFNNFSFSYDLGNYGDSMDFWFDVFVKAGGEPE